jgi:uncharacterized protein VcgC/VcgE DUF2780
MSRCISTIVVAIGAMVLSTAAFAQTGATAQAPGLEKTANPELVGEVAKELNATPAQAEGATGALFGLAKSRLSKDDWTKVAGAVPGIDGLLKAAPEAATGTSGVPAVPGVASKAAGLSSLAGSFSKLGLSPDMAAKAVPVLSKYVTKTGGADVAKLLAGALK